MGGVPSRRRWNSHGSPEQQKLYVMSPAGVWLEYQLSPEDYDRVIARQWHAWEIPGEPGRYTAWTPKNERLATGRIYLHHFVLGLLQDNPRSVKFINGDPYDVRRENLRTALKPPKPGSTRSGRPRTRLDTPSAIPPAIAPPAPSLIVEGEQPMSDPIEATKRLDEEELKAVELYESGLSCGDIAIVLNTYATRIKKLVNTWKVTQTTLRPITADEINEDVLIYPRAQREAILADYQSGRYSLDELRLKYGIDFYHCRALLLKAGVAEYYQHKRKLILAPTNPLARKAMQDRMAHRGLGREKTEERVNAILAGQEAAVHPPLTAATNPLMPPAEPAPAPAVTLVPAAPAEAAPLPTFPATIPAPVMQQAAQQVAAAQGVAEALEFIEMAQEALHGQLRGLGARLLDKAVAALRQGGSE